MLLLITHLSAIIKVNRRRDTMDNGYRTNLLLISEIYATTTLYYLHIFFFNYYSARVRKYQY